ncbi:hypothetical protein KIW84_042534 [Lathyrus oleraceus]|uniref:Replication protein A 70 kDa DNA-binding subunit B/D first OB fold domain-containing protein n=1 Tax=Pisum sativum TaxID=3888 RepID=A0A9D5AQN0_PEA|nr:hypothetical protein KIW84_042534 [Pisum sativum]
MSRKVDSVKDINDSKETWRLAVRIMDVWSVVNNKGIEHLEMIVMDSLGDRIQVLIRHDHLLKWKEVIKENMTCIINNGSVYNNDFQWKILVRYFKANGKPIDWKETLCVTVATTLKFVVSKYGWFYYGCTRCSSKAPNPEKSYECSCGQKVEQPIPRYKIEIYVSNGESKYRFVFWDSECAAILGMTAEFMHNSMVENQSKTEYAKLVPNKENLETSVQTLSASGENDPESIILMTPAKDVLIADKGEEVDFEASGATQLSGTKPSKKLKIEPSS